MGFVEARGEIQASTRIRRNTCWDTIQFTANGIIFVLLVEQLPMILAGATETVRLTGHHGPWWLALYVFAITLGLAVLRFTWVWISFRLTLARRGGRSEEHTSELQSLMRSSYAVFCLKKKKTPQPTTTHRHTQQTNTTTPY